MPRYTDAEVETINSLLSDLVVVLDDALQRSQILPKNTVEFLNLATLVPGGTWENVSAFPVIFPFDMRVKSDGLLINSINAGKIALSDIRSLLQNPTVQPNAPLNTIPPQPTASDLTQILLAIGRAHQSENNALFEIRARVTEIKSYAKATREQQQLNNSITYETILQRIQDVRTELKEARTDAKAAKQSVENLQNNVIPQLQTQLNNVQLTLNAILNKVNTLT